MFDVFISYPQRERGLMLPIKHRLESLGLILFVDVDGRLDGEATFPEALDKGVRASKAVLGCWSPWALTRPWVRKECAFAMTENKLVAVERLAVTVADVPLQFHDVDRKPLINFNGTAPHEGWAMTLNALATKLKLWSEKHPNHPEIADVREKIGILKRAAATERAGLAELFGRLSGDGLETKQAIHVGAPQRWCHGTPDGIFVPGDGRIQWFQDDATTPDMVVVPALAGGKPFAVSRYPITFSEWDDALRDIRIRPSDNLWGRVRRPVINISWHDAERYISWLGARTKQPYRFLSEAEWVHCCAAGSQHKSTPGSALGSLDLGMGPGDVDDYGPNQWGLRGMLGCVWQWCGDPAPAVIGSGLQVAKGGCWTSAKPSLAPSLREYCSSLTPDPTIGLRVARDIV